MWDKLPKGSKFHGKVQNKMIRLDKYLCDLGIGTRSQVKELIRKGLVCVNSLPAKKPELKVDESADTVTVQGKVCHYEKYSYYLLHKPAGVVSATEDKKEKTVLSLLKDVNTKDLFPVGRLDKDTEGLLLLTNDGKLAHELLSPKKHVDKTYLAFLRSPLTKETCKQLAEGVDIGDEKPTLPAKVLYPATSCQEDRLLKLVEISLQENRNIEHTLLLTIPTSDDISQENRNASASDKISAELRNVSAFQETSPEHTLLLTIHEGRFHQVKRMLQAVGNEVLYLKRLSFGPLLLDPSLAPGAFRSLTAKELADLLGKKGDIAHAPHAEK